MYIWYGFGLEVKGESTEETIWCNKCYFLNKCSKIKTIFFNPLWIFLLRLEKMFVFACCPLQVKTEISVENKHQTLQGLAFPLQETAKRALQQLAQKRINYIQLVSHHQLWASIYQTFPLRELNILYTVDYHFVAEVGCREGDNRAGPLQPDRNKRFAPQSSQRHSQIPLLPLQTLPRRRLPGICGYVTDCLWQASFFISVHARTLRCTSGRQTQRGTKRKL